MSTTGSPPGGGWLYSALYSSLTIVNTSAALLKANHDGARARLPVAVPVPVAPVTSDIVTSVSV